MDWRRVFPLWALLIAASPGVAGAQTAETQPDAGEPAAQRAVERSTAVSTRRRHNEQYRSRYAGERIVLEEAAAHGVPATAGKSRLHIGCDRDGPQLHLDLGFDPGDEPPVITTQFEENGAGTRGWRISTRRRAVFYGDHAFAQRLYDYSGMWVRVDAPGHRDARLFFDLGDLQRKYATPEDLCRRY